MSQMIFKRYELKYMLTRAQKEKVLEAMAPYMELDEYGRSVIRNIYYDTENFRLIRASIEKPAYKEKLRVRSYKKANGKDTVFVELKKKYDHVVYKRRVSLPGAEADDWLSGKKHCHLNTQISREIDYFLNYYDTIRPQAFISYEREAWFTKEKSDFRVTFDENILCRLNDLSLASENYGTPVLDPEMTLMEIKCSGGIPLWMATVLSENKIYKTSFSKYGTAYKQIILPRFKLRQSIAYIRNRQYLQTPQLALQA